MNTNEGLVGTLSWVIEESYKLQIVIGVISILTLSILNLQ